VAIAHPQTPRRHLAPASVRMDALQRRALINGGIAGLVTLVIGIAVVAAASSDPIVLPPSPSGSATPSAPACVPSWEVVQGADPSDVPDTLLGVTALAATEAWAVGGSGDPTAPADVLIERWDGSAWTAEEGPSPGSQTNELLDVDASGPGDVWAVGRTASGFGDRPLALHYDGIQWLDVELPEEVSGRLTGVAAIAPDDVWVVGFTGAPAAFSERAQLLHWDGALWALVDAGRAVGVGRSALLDVEAVSPTDVWAVGYLHNRPLMIRFDGQAWSRTETQGKGVANAIEPVTQTDAWIVGPPIQRFDGAEWSEPENVRVDGELVSVAAVSPDDLWAVGSRVGANGATTRAIVMRFDGRRWVSVAGPNVPGSDALTAVDALPDGTALAVGYRDVEAGRRTLTIRGASCPALS
jgi:hypothetical protein